MLSGLDLKTIAICHIGMVGFVGLVLVFCRVHQKTYAGFDFWVAGSICAILGYLAMLARLMGFEAASILLGNGLFVLSGLLRLEATQRFLQGRPVRWWVYGTVPLVVAGIAHYYYVDPSISMRNLLVSVAVTGFTLRMSWEFFRHAGAKRLALYRAIGFVMAAFSALMMLRAIMWCLHPDVGLFDKSNFHAPYVFGAILGEMGMGVAFLLINSQRLEEELAASQQELQEKLAEIKVLSGMLPICASCKSIHDGQGQWEKIESYVQRHSHAEFSHSICPECVQQLYPEFAQELRADGR